MSDNAGTANESQRCRTGGLRIKARDIIVDISGIVMGVLVLLGALVAIGVKWDHGLPGGIALFVSVCLFIPGRVYRYRIGRAIGFPALVLATALSVGCLGFVGLMVHHFWSAPPCFESIGLLSMAAVAFLIGFVLAHLAAGLLLAKLRPGLARGGISVAVGIALGLLYVLLVYLRYFQDWA